MDGMTPTCGPSGELIVTPTPWYRRALASLPMYCELSAAHVAEEVAPLRARLQQEWAFDAGLVSLFTFVFFFVELSLIPDVCKACSPFFVRLFSIRYRWDELTMAIRANAAIFAITPDSTFKINSHAYIAIATSSTAWFWDCL